MKTLRVAAAAALLIASTGIAFAQTTLRIGLAEDPDILDPSLARTYVGRIVFASFCDKLFDIDEKLNVVPQLALGYEIAPDGLAMTINLRPNVKFHDGEKFDAEAAKYSLERHMTMTGFVSRNSPRSTASRSSIRSPSKSLSKHRLLRCSHSSPTEPA